MSEPAPVCLHGAASHDLSVPGREQVLHLEVSMPAEYGRTQHSYPAVYLLDGCWYFPIVAQMMHLLELAQELPPVLVVGIGYEPLDGSPEEEYERCLRLRCRDLTPTSDPGEWWRRAGAAKPIADGIPTGGARAFLQLIEDSVKPLVREHYRVDVADETLVGHSLGGLCVLDELFRHPKRYRRYLASSPSLWWDREVIFEVERDYAAIYTDLPKELFLCVGALEESGPAAVSRMVSNVRRLTETLRARNYPSLHWRSRILEEATHVTGIPTAFVQGLQCLFTLRSEGSGS
jgi:uncharacterized protein